jgi:hypothetical protein
LYSQTLSRIATEAVISEVQKQLDDAALNPTMSSRECLWTVNVILPIQNCVKVPVDFGGEKRIRLITNFGLECTFFSTSAVIG